MEDHLVGVIEYKIQIVFLAKLLVVGPLLDPSLGSSLNISAYLTGRSLTRKSNAL